MSCQNGASEQVAHLQANQGLAAAGGGCGNFRFHAEIGSVFELEEHLSLYADGID